MANNLFGNVSSNASNSASSRSSAKGVILLIGDDMSSAQITAARWDIRPGENLTTYANTSINMNHFDYDEFVGTYSANSFNSGSIYFQLFYFK
jgi:alkaline phosphatase